MSIPETSPRLQAVRTIAKVRGYKELSEKQMADIHELLPCSELTAAQIADIILDAPAERTARTVKAVRNHGSNILTKLGQALKAD